MPTYEAAGLVMVSPSATATELTTTGNKSFHRVVGNDDTQGAAAVNYIKDVLKAQKVFVIDDGQTYGAGIIARGQEGPGHGGGRRGQGPDRRRPNFDATISKIKAAGAGRDRLRRLHQRGGAAAQAAPRGRRHRPSSSASTASTTPASRPVPATAAEGAIVTCPCLPGRRGRGHLRRRLRDGVRHATPGSYGAEGYDAAKILLEGFKAGKTTRKDLLDWVNAYDKAGLSRSTIKFDDDR